MDPLGVAPLFGKPQEVAHGVRALGQYEHQWSGGGHVIVEYIDGLSTNVSPRLSVTKSTTANTTYTQCNTVTCTMLWKMFYITKLVSEKYYFHLPFLP